MGSVFKGVTLRHDSVRDEAFRRFAADSAAGLGRLAYLLCGDRHFAQDLVQICLIRMYRAWPRIWPLDAPERYAQKVLLRCWLNERRKPWRHSEIGDGIVPDHADESADPLLAVGSTHLKEQLRTALATVPPKQRAAVVLRYWSQLSVTETAAALRCSEGTVKSNTARGLAALRTSMTDLGAGEFDEEMSL
ncbi:MAG TPA: SigE family RNA polymerase sigma factor [Pseudonocardiaceae bacterium]|nr:SigE family RNA polymerase sigma factor [Pseudonocardiaceae bacterium]